MGRDLGSDTQRAFFLVVELKFRQGCRDQDIKHQSPKEANINIYSEAKMFLIIFQNLGLI